ncbi:MAG: helix-turn-helix transcriptional regulator [Firmicutes bacterium]|nr:helix-turn-helix transcriptional regulator [Bacillota bacterium]
MNKSIMAQKLRALRGKRTQAEVAAAVGITTSAYAMYEQGERIPRDDTKVRLANYFNQSINFIFFDDNTHFEL